LVGLAVPGEVGEQVVLRESIGALGFTVAPALFAAPYPPCARVVEQPAGLAQRDQDLDQDQDGDARGQVRAVGGLQNEREPPDDGDLYAEGERREPERVHGVLEDEDGGAQKLREDSGAAMHANANAGVVEDRAEHPERGKDDGLGDPPIRERGTFGAEVGRLFVDVLEQRRGREREQVRRQEPDERDPQELPVDGAADADELVESNAITACSDRHVATHEEWAYEEEEHERRGAERNQVCVEIAVDPAQVGEEVQIERARQCRGIGLVTAYLLSLAASPLLDYIDDQAANFRTEGPAETYRRITEAVVFAAFWVLGTILDYTRVGIRMHRRPGVLAELLRSAVFVMQHPVDTLGFSALSFGIEIAVIWGFALLLDAADGAYLITSVTILILVQVLVALREACRLFHHAGAWNIRRREEGGGEAEEERADGLSRDDLLADLPWNG
jgi:hypothetical protein